MTHQLVKFSIFQQSAMVSGIEFEQLCKEIEKDYLSLAVFCEQSTETKQTSSDI